MLGLAECSGVMSDGPTRAWSCCKVSAALGVGEKTTFNVGCFTGAGGAGGTAEVRMTALPSGAVGNGEAKMLRECLRLEDECNNVP